MTGQANGAMDRVVLRDFVVELLPRTPMTLIDAPRILPTTAGLLAGAVRLESDASDARAQPVDAPARTVWGFDPVQLHTRFWAAQGVQVVRQGEPSAIVDHAELYLL